MACFYFSSLASPSFTHAGGRTRTASAGCWWMYPQFLSFFTVNNIQRRWSDWSHDHMRWSFPQIKNTNLKLFSGTELNDFLKNVSKQRAKNLVSKKEKRLVKITIVIVITIVLNNVYHGGEHGGKGLLRGSSSPGSTSTTTFSFFGRNTAA